MAQFIEHHRKQIPISFVSRLEILACYPTFLLLVTVLIFSNQTAFSQQTVGVFSNDEASFNGYTLISGIRSDTTYLIDNCGYQVNSWASDLKPGLAAVLVENGDLVRSGQVVNPIFSGGGSGGMIQKFSWEGDLLWNYQHSDQTKHQHHDIEVLPNGNILILAWEYRSAAEAIDNGRDPSQLQASIWPTRITEVIPVYPDDATIVWEWTMWDHLIQDYDATKAGYGVVADHPELLDINFTSSSAEDWIHCNSVKYNSTLDQIVLSARNTNELYVIDHSTTTAEAASHSGGNSGMGGDILYRWGNPMIYDRGDTTDQKNFEQHDVHWIPDSFNDGGKFLVFNNIWSFPTLESSINIVDPPMISGTGNYVDPGNSAYDPVDFDWHYVHPAFISGHMSSAQRLANGNTLINFADRGHLIEVDTSESLVWEYISAAGQGESIIQGNPASLNQIFRATRYSQEFPAFENRDLTPGNLIEIDSLPAPCTIFPEPTLSLNEAIDKMAIKVSLNNGFLSIFGDNSTKGSTAIIYDTNGKAIRTFEVEGGNHYENLGDISSGVYLLNLQSNRNNYTVKFVNQ